MFIFCVIFLVILCDCSRKLYLYSEVSQPQTSCLLLQMIKGFLNVFSSVITMAVTGEVEQTDL